MSFLKLREHWSARTGTTEELGRGCLAISSLDSLDGRSFLVAGTRSGVLRVSCPQAAEFRVDDLMLEENLELPILQLATGPFLSEGKVTALAVLHPRTVGVPTISGAHAATDETAASSSPAQGVRARPGAPRVQHGARRSAAPSGGRCSAFSPSTACCAWSSRSA